MKDPALWYTLSVLFVLAGVLNLIRGLRRTDARRPVSLSLAAAAFMWAATAALFRFGPNPAFAYVAGGLAVATMLFGAYLSAQASKQNRGSQ